jgi:hypothetical protein
MHGMAQGFEQQLANPDSAELGFEERFGMLVEAQWFWRENQAIKSKLRKATLKMPASIEDINYRHARQLERSMIRSLSAAIGSVSAITSQSGPRNRKTYICCALWTKPAERFLRPICLGVKFFRRWRRMPTEASTECCGIAEPT